MKRKNQLQKLSEMVKNNSLLILFFFITSCGNIEDQMGITSIEEAILKQRALRGDQDAYNKLSSFYAINLKYEKGYYVSRVVTNKYHYKEAYLCRFGVY